MSLETQFEQHLYQKAVANLVPISGTFELLPMCNLNCKMCYVKKSASEVEKAGGLFCADDWIQLGRKAVDAGMLFLLLTGGEPFLYPEFEYLYTELYKMGLAIDINSNGTMIGEKEVAMLKKHPPRHIKISLYGASEESYRKLCGNGQAFYKVLNAFKALKEAGVIVYSSITVTPQNYHELEDMLDLCEEYHIPVKSTSYMFPPLRSKNDSYDKDYRLSPEDAAKATMMIAKRNNSEEAFYERAGLYAEQEYQNFTDYIGQGMECGQTKCRAGLCTFWINWRGQMMPCAMMEMGLFPVMGDSDFMEAWRGVNEIIRGIYLSPECTCCPAREACYSCAASAYCETGDTGKRPEYPCQMTAHYMKCMKEEYEKRQKR